MTEANVKSVWLGIHDLYNDESLTTVLDEPYENACWEKWAVDKKKYMGNKFCVYLEKSTGMYLTNCSIQKFFVCRKYAT